MGCAFPKKGFSEPCVHISGFQIPLSPGVWEHQPNFFETIDGMSCILVDCGFKKYNSGRRLRCSGLLVVTVGACTLCTPSGAVASTIQLVTGNQCVHNNSLIKLNHNPSVHSTLEASARSCDTLDTNTGLVANTLIGKSQTIVSTSTFAGPCHRTPVSGQLAPGGASFGSGVLDVMNSKWRRQRRETEQRNTTYSVFS